MKNIDGNIHVRGQSVYVDDIPELSGTLYAVPILSGLAHAQIESIDTDSVRSLPGVVAVFTAADIPGENQIGGILDDEPLFADGEIHFRGQPLGLVVATSRQTAYLARKKIRISALPLEIVTDPRTAKQKGQLLIPPRTFESGNIDSAIKNCSYVFSGRADSAGQEHLYIETQGSYAVPGEKGTLKIYSSTQGPTLVQKMTARVLGLPMYQVEVDVTRLGGAFGGKEDQATAWAVMAGLAASRLNAPVKLILSRADDMYATGKRHPYTSDFRIGLDKEYRITCFEVTYYQNGGASADLSPAILERSLFHVTNAYHIPHVRATAYSCQTNLAPFTAFRGFGGPQAMFVIESAIVLAARELGLDPSVIQERNLMGIGHLFHYGQPCGSDHARDSWNGLVENVKAKGKEKKAKEEEANGQRKLGVSSGSPATVRSEKEIRSFVTECRDFLDEIRKFNREHEFRKKGWAMMPVCFGISFTNTSMNQARALVHIYQDGSVSVSTGAIEMGQGVNTKLTQVAAQTLGIDSTRIRLETTNTRRVANTSPTAASSGADLNGRATQIACLELLGRLKETAAKRWGVDKTQIEIRDEWVYVNREKSTLDWEKLIQHTFLDRVQLSAVGHYATPLIHFDKSVEKGHPFAYHVFGTALTEVEVDAWYGTYVVDRVRIVHDFGQSLNPIIDTGQVEGALMQGIGWMTVEELVYDEYGRLLSDSLSKYKVPDIYMAPRNVEITALETSGEPMAVFRSKAVGEPPLMYGIGTFFALQKAIQAFNPNYQPVFDAPMTPEKVLMALYGK